MERAHALFHCQTDEFATRGGTRYRNVPWGFYLGRRLLMRARLWPRPGSIFPDLPGRQKNSDPCPLSACGLHFDHAADEVDKLLNDREAEPAALMLSANAV